MYWYRRPERSSTLPGDVELVLEIKDFACDLR